MKKEISWKKTVIIIVITLIIFISIMFVYDYYANPYIVIQLRESSIGPAVVGWKPGYIKYNIYNSGKVIYNNDEDNKTVLGKLSNESQMELVEKVTNICRESNESLQLPGLNDRTFYCSIKGKSYSIKKDTYFELVEFIQNNV